MPCGRLWCAAARTHALSYHLTARPRTVCFWQLPHTTPFPGKRSVVILDNASIHHQHAFDALMAQAGVLVYYTPPYCFDCTPLDNGAFGMVRRYLQRDKARIFGAGGNGQVPMDMALDAAFRSVKRRGARYCFRNCGYT